VSLQAKPRDPVALPLEPDPASFRSGSWLFQMPVAYVVVRIDSVE
jgi:hypothetical protein